MADASLKKQTISGVIWKVCERSLTQAVSFVVSIVLARLLSPNDYGLIALVIVFATICDKLIICGFATSLIQKKDADKLDFSTVFVFSIIAAAVLYALLFAGAPLIADFFSKYDRPLLIRVIRIYGLSLFMIALNSVQHAFASRHMQFKVFFWAKLVGTVISAFVGIIMAYAGFGVWSLVGQTLSCTLSDCVVMWFAIKWRPTIQFSRERLRSLFSYGWKIFAASIIRVIYNDIRSLVIGKVYTPADLAFYNKGQSFPQIIDNNVNGTIDSVLFPAISKLQSSPSEMVSALRRAIKTSCFLIMPLLACLAAVSDPLILVLLTDKWIESAPYLTILSFAFLFTPIELENLQAIKAIGRSDIVLKLEVVKKVLGLLILVASIPFGVKAIAIGMMLSMYISTIINIYPNKSLLAYSYSQQFIDVMPSISLTALSFLCTKSFQILVPISNNLIEFILCGFIFFIVYLGVAKMFNMESLNYILTTIRKQKNE